MNKYAQRSALQLAKPLFSPLQAPATENYEKLRGKSTRGGLTAQKPRYFGYIFDFSAFQAAKPRKNEEFEQGVAGYDPQVIAWHRPSHAATLSSTARGSSPER